MSKLTNCPNCGAKWSYEEQETDSCDSCGYPNHVVNTDNHGTTISRAIESVMQKRGDVLGIEYRPLEGHEVFDGSESAPLKMDEAGLLPQPCSGRCGMNYCADNGCLEKKHVLAEGPIPLKHPEDHD